MSGIGTSLGVVALVFVVSLPLSIMLGAAILGLRDVQDKRPNVVRLLICAAAALALLFVFGEQVWPVMASAAAAVVVLHLIAYWGLRWWVKRIRTSPP